MFRMTDEKGGDDKVLCVPAVDPRTEHLRDIHRSASPELTVVVAFQLTVRMAGGLWLSTVTVP
jgi:inorganic pyrophosphatase